MIEIEDKLFACTVIGAFIAVFTVIIMAHTTKNRALDIEERRIECMCSKEVCIK